MGQHDHEHHHDHDHEHHGHGHHHEHHHGHDHGHHGHGHHHEHAEEPVDLKLAIITCSDTRTLEEDTAGAALESFIAAAGWTCVDRTLVKDERADIAAAIVRAADELAVDVVLTCGGSGLSLRDVTPEATADVCDRNVPGIAEAMRQHSLRITPHAMLSRAVCMQRGRCLVVNLPGSKKAATENWEAIEGILPHAVKMMAGGGH